MITKIEILNIHKRLIEEFGGGQGIRDEGALESALVRPYTTFGGQDLYPTPEAKASAIIESVLINHPFIDGNKRTGYILLRLTMMKLGKDIRATEEEKYEIVIGVAAGKIKFDEILSWMKGKSIN